jgi:hypothetical protein
VSYRSHQAYTDEGLAGYRALRARGSVGKADVLSTLGPPLEVIGQESGEAFVYRRRALDTNVVNLNPSMVSGLGPTVPVPLYFGSFTRGRDDVLMLFFDAEGRLRGDGLRLGVGDGGGLAP